MRGGLHADWLPSGQALLVISALADVLFRLPEDLTAPLVSLAGGVFGSQRVALVTTWVVLYVALYTFAHLAYSFLDNRDGLALPRTEPGFRFLFATTGVALGVAVNQIETQTTLFAIVIPGAFAVGGSFLVYLSVWHDWQVTEPEGQGVAVLDRFSPHEDAAGEIQSDLAYEGVLGFLALTFYLLALSIVFGAPVVLAAFALQILVYSFPIPDLLILGWAVSTRAIPQVTIGPDRDRILDLEFELERYLVDVIEHATRSVQGFFLLTFCVLGAFLAAGFLFIGVAILPNAVELVLTGGRLLLSGQPVRDLLPVWNVLGTVTLLFVAGTHGLWVWIRELQRLPHFLDAWEDRDTRSETEPVTRVSGFVGVTSIAWLAAVTVIAFHAGAVAVGFAVTWPVIIAVGLWTVRGTLQRDSQDVKREHRWISAGFVGQTLVALVGFTLPGIATALSENRSPVSQLGTPIAVTVLLIFVVAIPNVHRYEQQYDDVRRYSMVGLLLVFGAVSAFGSRVISPQYRFGVLALSVVALVSGFLLGFVRYYRL